MRTTVERPPIEVPDAGEMPGEGETPEDGVIEEARARQHRHRGLAAAAMVAAGVIAAILFAFTGGGGGSRSGSATGHPGRAPSKTAGRPSPSSCQGKALQGPPSKSLLSILGVLRRPATAADAGSGITAQGFTSAVFVHYIRLARVIAGSSFYIYPGIVGGCGTGEKPHEGIMESTKHVNLGHGLLGGTGGGGSTAATIEQGQTAETGPPGTSTSATITMIVPDGVASVTLRYPAGRASGYSPKISPPFTVTTAAVNNLVVVGVPRSAGGGPIRKPTMIWRAANGHIIKTFDRL
jgi:hypothetical protein